MDPILTELGIASFESIAQAIQRDEGCRRQMKEIAFRFISWLDGADRQADSASATPLAEQIGERAIPPISSATHAASDAMERGPDMPVSEATPREVKRMMLRIGDHEVPVDATEDGLAGAPVDPTRRVGANPTVIAVPAPPVAHDLFESDPRMIAARCRLKAEACGLSGERRRRRLAGEEWWDVTEEIGRLIASAKALPNCYLWPIDPRGPELPPDATLADLAGSYEALADAVEVLARCQAERELGSWIEPGARLAAEAQSALRAGMRNVNFLGDENDQQAAYRWLTGLTREHGLYIDRFMRADDPADPSGWADLRGRIGSLSGSIEQRRKSKRERAQLFGKIRYLVGRLIRERAAADASEWRPLRASVDALLALKVPPRDAGLREVLLPLVESDLDLPPDFMLEGTGTRQVLDDIGRYLEFSASDRSDSDEEAAEDYGHDVTEVARLLRGRRVVLIGGEPRAPAKAALERAFELSELVWLSAPAHSSFWSFEPAIARPDTAVVLLMIRWSSHSYGEVRSICERFGKPLVRLPAGYNPAQVAFQVLQQCGDQLRATASSGTADLRPARPETADGATAASEH